jgi:hypothetical protein
MQRSPSGAAAWDAPVRLSFDSPDYGPRIMDDYYKLQYQLYTTGTKCSAILLRGMQDRAVQNINNLMSAGESAH